MLFFGSAVYMLFRKFTRTDTETTKEKQHRNRVYWICAWIISLCVFLLALNFFLKDILKVKPMPNLESYSAVFWIESVAVWAFGISWITKGEALLADITNKSGFETS